MNGGFPDLGMGLPIFDFWFSAQHREACFLLYRYYICSFKSTYHWNLQVFISRQNENIHKTDLYIEEVTYCVGLQRKNRFSLSAGLAVSVCLLHAKSLYIVESYLYLSKTFGLAQSHNFKTSYVYETKLPNWPESAQIKILFYKKKPSQGFTQITLVA